MVPPSPDPGPVLCQCAAVSSCCLAPRDGRHSFIEHDSRNTRLAGGDMPAATMNVAGVTGISFQSPIANHDESLGFAVPTSSPVPPRLARAVRAGGELVLQRDSHRPLGGLSELTRHGLEAKAVARRAAAQVGWREQCNFLPAHNNAPVCG